ncbi:MAG: glycine cleavage system protein T [Acidimicrobiales bacterium]|nr:glycine cleavage system protein T [Acidimicrobiales bacterium]RZV45458.1 MAG: glycine cleavage system protein T [Acidimicrobiales bacterium]
MSRITISPRIRMTPFHESTVAAGLSDLTVYNKMVLPTSYGDLKAEYDRLINGVALWDVSAERQVEVSGPDADACVQYLTSRDLGKQKEGQGYYVAMCDHAGRILNDPVLLKLSGNRYWFSLADSDMLYWCRAIAAEKGFDVEVCEPDVSPLALQGPKAEDLVAELFGEHIRDLRYFGFIETDLDGIPLVLCRSGWSKQGGFELFLQDGSRGNELYQKVLTAGEKYDIGPGAPNHVERVESALLSWGGDTTPESNPFESGMGRFVHTDTDVDYIGKEALQAIVANGGPERLLCGLIVEDETVDAWPLPARTPVRHNGEEVGTMSAIVHSHRMDKTIALAQVRRDLVEQGEVVQVEGPAGQASATITSLPFL